MFLKDERNNAAFTWMLAATLLTHGVPPQSCLNHTNPTLPTVAVVKEPLEGGGGGC